MTTKLIGIKDFRQNLAEYTKKINKENMIVIVLKKNVPVLEIRPIDEKKFAFEKLEKEIKEAREDVKKGRIYSQDDIMKEFGLS